MHMQTAPQLKQTVGINIAAVRSELRLSRRAFGDLVGVDQMLIYKWERGLNGPSRENLIALAAATGRDPSWFYADHGPKAKAA